MNTPQPPKGFAVTSTPDHDRGIINVTIRTAMAITLTIAEGAAEDQQYLEASLTYGLEQLAHDTIKLCEAVLL